MEKNIMSELMQGALKNDRLNKYYQKMRDIYNNPIQQHSLHYDLKQYQNMGYDLDLYADSNNLSQFFRNNTQKKLTQDSDQDMVVQHNQQQRRNRRNVNRFKVDVVLEIGKSINTRIRDCQKLSDKSKSISKSQKQGDGKKLKKMNMDLAVEQAKRSMQKYQMGLKIKNQQTIVGSNSNGSSNGMSGYQGENTNVNSCNSKQIGQKVDDCDQVIAQSYSWNHYYQQNKQINDKVDNVNVYDQIIDNSYSYSYSQNHHYQQNNQTDHSIQNHDKIDNDGYIDLKYVEVKYVSLVTKNISYLMGSRQLNFKRDKLSEPKVNRTKMTKKHQDELRKKNSVIRIYDNKGDEVNDIKDDSWGSWNKGQP